MFKCVTPSQDFAVGPRGSYARHTALWSDLFRCTNNADLSISCSVTFLWTNFIKTSSSTFCKFLSIFLSSCFWSIFRVMQMLIDGNSLYCEKGFDTLSPILSSKNFCPAKYTVQEKQVRSTKKISLSSTVSNLSIFPNSPDQQSNKVNHWNGLVRALTWTEYVVKLISSGQYMSWRKGRYQLLEKLYLHRVLECNIE